MKNKTIAKASPDTVACSGVKKCAETVFNRGRLSQAKGLDVLAKKMKALDPEQYETYKFLRCEQAEHIDTNAVCE